MPSTRPFIAIFLGQYLLIACSPAPATNVGDAADTTPRDSVSMVDSPTLDQFVPHGDASVMHDATQAPDVHDAGPRDVAPRPDGAPTLTPGVWTDITPPNIDLVNHFGTPEVSIDPGNPSILYLSADEQGLWKSTDGGSTWARLGDPSHMGWPSTSYLDSPVRIAVDPNDSQHLYATEGVRGETMGFFVSHDGGNTWTAPPGFQTASGTVGTRDMTSLAIDPTDFNHFLIGSHSAWGAMNLPNAGLLESTDGGQTMIVHAPPSSWPSGSLGLSFLYDPANHQGDAQTWMVMPDGLGFVRTTDAGNTWNTVETWGAPHGGCSTFYAGNGTLYAGGYQYPVRSTDNGATWTQITQGLGYSYYYVIYGDGHTLYTRTSYASNGVYERGPFVSSPESDGLTWTPYQGGAVMTDNGPATMAFDPINRIMYAGCWNAGLWALKVLN